MKHTAKINVKLDSVLEGKQEANIAISAGTCSVHPGRCDCADCKLLFDRRPKYFNANIARNIECRERLKRVLKKRRAEAEREVSESESDYYETEEESECETEDTKSNNLMDERTVEELVEFVQGAKGKKGNAVDTSKMSNKAKRRAQRRLRKQEKLNAEQEAIEKDESKSEAANPDSSKSGQAEGAKKIVNKRLRKDSSPSYGSAKEVSNKQAPKTEESVKKQTSRKEDKKASALEEPLKKSNQVSNKKEQKNLSVISKNQNVEDKSSDSTQQSSVETSRGVKSNQSDWAIVSYPKKPYRSAANESADMEQTAKSKVHKTKSSTTLFSETSYGNPSSYSAADYASTTGTGPILPTILLKKKKKTKDSYSNTDGFHYGRQRGSYHNLLDMKPNAQMPTFVISPSGIQQQQQQTPVAAAKAKTLSSISSSQPQISSTRPQVSSNPANILSNQSAAPSTIIQARISDTMFSSLMNAPCEKFENMFLGNKFGAIGEERKRKQNGTISAPDSELFSLGGFIEGSGDFEQVTHEHRGYSFSFRHKDDDRKQAVEEKRDYSCKFGAIGEERKKKMLVNDETLNSPARKWDTADSAYGSFDCGIHL